MEVPHTNLLLLYSTHLSYFLLCGPSANASKSSPFVKYCAEDDTVTTRAFSRVGDASVAANNAGNNNVVNNQCPANCKRAGIVSDPGTEKGRQRRAYQRRLCRTGDQTSALSSPPPAPPSHHFKAASAPLSHVPAPKTTYALLMRISS